jgi:hypothetical protein
VAIWELSLRSLAWCVIIKLMHEISGSGACEFDSVTIARFILEHVIAQRGSLGHLRLSRGKEFDNTIVMKLVLAVCFKECV